MANDFSPQIASLAPGVPIALLPVRLEARYFTGGDELRIRIFPDQIQIDAHEDELTAYERDAGVAYWTDRFKSPDPKTRTSTPWATLCGSVGASRAAWIVRALTPVNVAQISPAVAPVFPAVTLRQDDWPRAARATALPKRWLVIGTRTTEIEMGPLPGGDGPAPPLVFTTEIFRKWTSSDVSGTLEVTIAPDAATPPPTNALPLQTNARWLADFDEAERVGMAVRITSAECLSNASLKNGPVSKLYVFGVDWTIAPDVAAASLHRLMNSHVYSDGLSALEAGTPTNVTAAARPGAAPSDDVLVLALDPEKHPTPSAVNGNAADRLWRALGIVPTGDDLLTAMPGANSIEPSVTSHLVNALWESTLGSFVTDFLSPNVDDALWSDLRAHAVKYLHPGGPYPALRIGKQPYGVLPVLPRRADARGDTPIEDKLLKLAKKLEPFWQYGVERVPRVGRTTDLDADVTQVLQTTPLASTFRYRPVVGPLAVNATNGLTPFAEVQELTTNMVGFYLDWGWSASITGFAMHPGTVPLRVPLVDPKPIVPGVRMSVNYLQQIADLARSAGTYDAIKVREDASTLLEALAAYAVARELHRGDMRTILKHMVASGQIATLPSVGVLQAAEYTGIETLPAPQGGVTVTTQSEASRLIIPSVTGQQTVREFTTAAVKKGQPAPADFQSLGSALTSMEWLSTRPADQIERCLRGILDSYSHRLDAWITSLAARRLATVRAAKPTGIHLGAYGWLEDLSPSTAPVSQGYIHAPSLQQAATAAVLRSGHLAHNDAEHVALDLDHSGARVRNALLIIDGVAQGQPLTALLGYRFERALRDMGPLMAKFILPFRRLAPLRLDDTGQPTSPTDHISARDVVDGVALVDRWRTQGASLLAQLAPAPTALEAESLSFSLDNLAGMFDGVADVMVAEAVHQNVLGNAERAGAVLAALDRQEAPPSMDFVRTPRSGKSLTHRVLVLIGDESIPAVWSTIPLDPRARAEPRLNAWIARLLGDPKRVKFAATITASAGPHTLVVTLDELGISPLSLVMAEHAVGKDAPTELEARIAYLIAAKVTGATPATEIRLLDPAPVGSNVNTVGLGAFRSLLRWIYTLVTGQRAANANDLVQPEDGGDEGLDVAQVAARANAVATAFADAIAKLDQVTASASATDVALRDALWGAAALGVRAAVPARPPLLGATAIDHDELLSQARELLADMRAAATRQAALASAGVPPDATPAIIVAHHIERMRLLLGGHFPVLPRFMVRNATELSASMGDRATLCAGDDSAPAAWIQRMSLVRAGVSQLSRVLTGAEMIQGMVVPSEILVAQLPRTAGERWLALPFSVLPEAELSIGAVSSGVMNFSNAIAGLFCDAWPEVIPAREETTGMTFHFDAPGARPPQAVLIAVPPETAAPAWSVDALHSAVEEAHSLARMRGVGPAELRWLGTMLPAMCLPFSLSEDVPAVALDGLAAKYAAANAPTANILGKS